MRPSSPLDGERAGVADVIEGDDDVLELDVAATDGAEVPGATRVAEIGVAAEHADGAVAVTHQTSFMWAWWICLPKVRMNLT
jgi:hypothetical protein